MGGPSSPFWGQIQQNFNPWAGIQGFTGEQLGSALQPTLLPLLQQQAAQEQAFTSGGA
jgi:hypothetical protein